ncbi:ATP-dependent zinc protease [Sphingomicrobium sediminis]|uniref:RimK/LysX family protein n=1 Tax=Sphingomicrobium sediminis TaxID=2950949 RepID=A0A9X2EK82_9SPHN|nr:RimK/LysX family protein [Sphingomicrobium sediminis]MCM8558361.1 RimK/LysX family protein [Sphingomicrobium sediminis]
MKKGTVGWREWIALPGLGVEAVKAKVDTGARTSAIHAWKVRHFERDGREHISFCLHPLQDNDSYVVEAEAPLLEMRKVRSSNGQEQRRFVIETEVEISDTRYPIELTLTNRDEMGFRMLLGRQALRRRWLVDPGKSYLTRADADNEGDED